MVFMDSFLALPGFLPRTVQCVAKIVNICYPHFGAKTARSLDVEREPSVVHTASQWPLGPGTVDERHAQPCWPGGGCTPRHGPIRHSHAHTHTHTCIAHIAPCLSRESPRNPVAVQHAAAFIIPQAVLPVASPSRDFYVEWALRCSLTCYASVCVCMRLYDYSSWHSSDDDVRFSIPSSVRPRPRDGDGGGVARGLIMDHQNTRTKMHSPDHFKSSQFGVIFRAGSSPKNCACCFYTLAVFLFPSFLLWNILVRVG